MGVSVSVSWAIIGVALIVVSQLIVAVAFPAISDVFESGKELQFEILHNKQTDMAIDNITYSSDVIGYDFSITIKNLGSECITTDQCEVLIDGWLMNFSCTEPYVLPYETVTFTVEDVTITDDAEIKVVTNDGFESCSIVSMEG